MICRVQALIRGFLQRKKYKILKLTDQVSSKYFKQEEAQETLYGMYEDNGQLVTRTHTYKTMAVYSGKWKGGMRHGLGNMRWSDSAQYIGEWSYGQAQG